MSDVNESGSSNRLKFGEDGKLAPAKGLLMPESGEPEADKPVDGSAEDIAQEVEKRLSEEAAAIEATSSKATPVAGSSGKATREPTARNASGGTPPKTLQELQAQQAAIAKEIADRTAAERDGVLAQIREVAKTYNIPIEAIVDAFGGAKSKRAGSKAKVKYRDSVSGGTWSGRGKPPLWIKDKDRNQYLVTD